MDAVFNYGGIFLKISFHGSKVKRVKLFSGGEKAEKITYNALLGYTPDYSGFPGFESAVLEKVREIPYGRVTTYKEVARAIGKEKAYRAVGNVLAKNPFLVVVPCHRVIKSDLTIGNFSYGVEVKRKLLESEGVVVEGDRVKAKIFRFRKN